MPDWMEKGEGIYVAEFDIGAQRRYRESALGKALAIHHLEPSLCRVPLAEQYRQGPAEFLGQKWGFDVHRMWL